MNIHSPLKAFALLCILSIPHIFASHPIQQALPPLPAALQAKLDAIDADDDIACAVLSIPQDAAEEALATNKQEVRRLAQDHDVVLLANTEKKILCVAHKYWATHKEMQSCNDPVIRQQLQTYRDYFDAQGVAYRKEEHKTLNASGRDGKMPAVAYNYAVYKLGALRKQAAIERAQKEKAEAEAQKLKQEKTQWQQREQGWQQEKQELQAQLRGYDILENGLQVEGVPHAPGGPSVIARHKLVRSASH